MKQLYFSFLIFLNPTLFAQIPVGYYTSATGTGYTLKTQLHNIIDNHSPLSYTPGLWDLYSSGSAFKDNWYENNGSILDIYSENPLGTDAYEYTPIEDQCGNYTGEGSCYNREHIIPQSVFNENLPMVTDAFHIWPTDGSVNGKRGSFPFGKVATASWTSTNGSKLGSNLNSGYSAGYTGTVFEPIDEFKGDIARANFYFATRYEDEGIANWSYAMFNGTNNQVFTNTFRNILLAWHTMDPVSDREIAINDHIYSAQGNRNPYIDHPEWVYAIWGNPAGIDDMLVEVHVYPNPAQDDIYIENSTENSFDSYEIFSLMGQKVQSETWENKSSISIQTLNKGLYIVKIYSNKAVFLGKFIKE